MAASSDKLFIAGKRLAGGVATGDAARVPMHPDQLSISVDAVRTLIDRQFPAWRGLPVTELATSGTVNALFRIGTDYIARFPLRPGDRLATTRWLEAEAEAARELFARTRFRTPQPVALGSPGAGYPMPWSVQTWVSGTTAADSDPGTSRAFAADLAEFIDGVRGIDVRGRTFGGHGRGGDLHAHDDWIQTCFERSEQLLDVAPLRRLWAHLRALPRHRPDLMTHGDLIPGNVLVAHGRLTGVIDVGGLGPADPALDLVGAWHLLDDGPRHALRDVLGSDDVEWERGKAWAFEQSMGVVWYYATSNPVMSRMGARTLRRILEDQ
jgi:aminoglycoside phosphotransferase (APT) family kinase protein